MVCYDSVEIEDRRIKKPYLGGWKHKITQVEYLNAESQTGPLIKKPIKEKCSKKVQYIYWTEVSTQTPYHRSTQMARCIFLYYILNIDKKKVKKIDIKIILYFGFN